METQATLLARLAAAGIETRTVQHPPVFTVAESRALRPDLPGAHCKNLFLRPAKGEGPFALLVLEEARQISVNAAIRAAGLPRMGFASAEELRAELGVEPGSVTAFGLVNARPDRVVALFDRALVAGVAWLNLHPLVNSATTAIAPAALLDFLRGLGHAPRVIDLD